MGIHHLGAYGAGRDGVDLDVETGQFGSKGLCNHAHTGLGDRIDTHVGLRLETVRIDAILMIFPPPCIITLPAAWLKK